MYVYEVPKVRLNLWYWQFAVKPIIGLTPARIITLIKALEVKKAVHAFT